MAALLWGRDDNVTQIPEKHFAGQRVEVVLQADPKYWKICRADYFWTGAVSNGGHRRA